MNANLVRKASAAFAACLAIPASPLFAGPGNLDTTFGVGGKVTTAIGTSHDRASGMAIQSDGKLLVAGGSFNGTDYDFALLRYHADGSLDPSFGNLGMIVTPIGSHQDYARSVAVQSDGKIVVAGDSYNGSNSDFAVLRYHSNGGLDTGFGSGGKVIVTISGTSSEIGRSVAVQSDGKILVAGFSDNGTVNDDFAIVRLNGNGTLDGAFGSGGKVTTPVGSGDDHGYGMAVQSDGKILVAGDSVNGSGNNDFALLRYLSEGSLDSTFGTGGKLITPIGIHDDSGQSVVLQSDGKILVAGLSSNGDIDDYDFVVVRYHADGNPDTTFGSGGKVVTDLGSDSDDSAHSVAVQSDGKIVVAGSSNNITNNDFALVRYLANGALDTSFGNGGRMTTPVGNTDDFGWSVAVQADGKIVVAGDSHNGSNYDFALVCYLGTTEPEIAVEDRKGNHLTDGISTADFGQLWITMSPGFEFTIRNPSTATLTGLKVSLDGANAGDYHLGTFATSTLGPGESMTFQVILIPQAIGLRTAMMHITSNDADENPFEIALTGTVVGPTILTTGLLPYAMVGVPYNFTLQASGGTPPYTWDCYNNLPPGISLSDDGVLSGTPVSVTTMNFLLAASDDDGARSAMVSFTLTVLPALHAGDLDPSFGNGGKVTTAIGSADDFGYGTALQADGKILVAGYAQVGSNEDFALARYHSDGMLDTSFGNGGMMTTAVGPGGDFGKSVVVQSDGKILVAGDAWNGSSYSFALVRYLANGTLDAAFGSGGKVITLLGAPSYGRSVMVQSNGKILVAGEMDADGVDFGIVRYLADGSIDTTFGTGGKVTTDLGNAPYYDYAQSAALQSDDKILVAGYAPGVSNSDFAMVRYLVNGGLDTAFGNGGKVVTPIGTGGDYGRSVAVQSDGKIVVAGEIGGGDFAMARYETTGILDTGFGSAGKVITTIGIYDDFPKSVTLQNDGKIVVVGYSGNGSNYDIALARFQTNGTLDPSFGTGGKVMTPVGTGHDFGRCVVVQGDGKIVVAGSADVGGGNDDFALVRYIGSLEPEIAVKQASGIELADGGGNLDFGAVVPAKTVSGTITVRNAGTASLTGLAVTKDGTNSADFTVVDLATTSLAPGASITLAIDFKPGAVGPRTAAIHIASNDADENPFDIDLTGTGYSGTPLQAWRLAHFGSADDSGDGANLNDFDKDGFGNLLEYASGGDPKSPDAVEIRLVPVFAGGRLGISFKCDADCADITYTVQASMSLGADSWTDIARSVGGMTVVPVGTLSDVSDSGTGLRMATVRASPALFPTGRGFLRIKVSE